MNLEEKLEIMIIRIMEDQMCLHILIHIIMLILIRILTNTDQELQDYILKLRGDLLSLQLHIFF
ncbi:hypothetical protein SABR111722_18080 [Saccharibacillus brassicae]